MSKRANSLAALAAAACMAVPAMAQDTVTADTVVATVNGADITVGHMLLIRTQLPEQYQQLPTEVLFEGIREQLIQQAALAQSLTDVPKRVELSLENDRRTLIAGEALNIAVAAAVTDDALQAAYDAQFADATPEKEFNASHILVETEEEAAEITAELEAGANFAELARARSTGPSGPSGGVLGWFGPGRMVKPFEDAVVTMDVGQISAPVQTQFGWHVIILNETREMAIPSLDEVRESLTAEIQRTAADSHVNGLVEAATVTRAEEGAIDPAVLNDASLLQD